MSEPHNAERTKRVGPVCGAGPRCAGAILITHP